MTNLLNRRRNHVLCGILLGLLIIAGRLITLPVAGAPQEQTTAPSEEVLIPEGQALMGCAADIWYKCDLDSQPVHAVYLDAYLIDKTEVTVAQYAACVNAGACTPPGSESPGLQMQQLAAQDDDPVTHVTWNQANTYCRWVGKRLPTEAEWEKAAHGTGPQVYPWGDEPPTCDRLNYNSCVGGVVPVGSYPQNASPYGVLDMAGNVREWVNDFYLKPYYARSPYFNPQGPKEEETVGEHLLRGGSWKDDAGGITTWIRFDEAETYYIYKAGIRCARTAPPNLIPTPTPLPTPTPIPPSTAVVGPAGGALWLEYPGHVTVLNVPEGYVTGQAVFTLTHQPLGQQQGSLTGFNHFLELDSDLAPLTASAGPAGLLPGPLELTLAYAPSPVVEETIALYGLRAGTWATDSIATLSKQPRYLRATVDQTGIYGLLGEGNLLFLPSVMRH
ncbi:MAG: SUMF1/EgtB/PvdO family nonheme iron enzyme [Anaerolineae bacterium]|nr:SUMF1/EgtB/PvdO family nonheme iron enzyme [Anaerolineae bacterium]